MSGVTDKLRLNKKEPFWLINAPVGVSAHFDGFVVKKNFDSQSAIVQVLLFVRWVNELDELIQRIRPVLDANALFWVAFPKKSGSIKSDISRDAGWECINDMGYEGVAAVAIDNDWSAIRFKPKQAKSTYIPPEDRKIEGIDFLARTVVLPADAKAMMKEHRGLDVFFDKMSFSHKKEYVAVIAEAKKPETRQKRIEKMINVLLKMKEVKDKKK